MLEVLLERELNGGKVITKADQVWRLEIPKMREGRYVLAQIDDYMHLPRGKFPHQTPINFQLESI